MNMQPKDMNPMGLTSFSLKAARVIARDEIHVATKSMKQLAMMLSNIGLDEDEESVQGLIRVMSMCDRMIKHEIETLLVETILCEQSQKFTARR